MISNSRRALLTLGVIASATVAVGNVAEAGTAPPTEPPASDAGDADLAEAAAAGYRAFLADVSDVVYVDEDSFKVGDCPLIDLDDFNAAMADAGLAGPFDNEAGGELEFIELPDEGDVIDPVGVYCDVDVDDDVVDAVESGSIFVGDPADEELADQMPRFFELVEPAPTQAAVGGELFTGCLDESDGEQTCLTIWRSEDLIVVFAADFVPPADQQRFDAAFTAILPTVLSTLAGMA